MNQVLENAGFVHCARRWTAFLGGAADGDFD